MSKSFKAGVLGVVFAIAAAFPALAVPIAMYDAAIDATLSLTGVTVVEGSGDADVLVFGDAFILDDFADSVGDASSSTGGAGVSPLAPTSMSEEPITVDISADGSATGIGFAESFLFSSGFVGIENISTTNTVRFDFELDYTVTAAASVTDTVLQAASSTAVLFLDSGQGDIFADIFLTADTEFLEPGGTLSDVVSFSILLGALNETSLNLQADVFGTLTSDLEPPAEVPIPSMAALFGLGALGLFFKGRRKS